MALLAPALSLAGCAATDQDLLARLRVPESAPRVSGLERAVDREQHRLAASFGGRYRWQPMDSLLQRVLERMARVTGRPAHAHDIIILNSPTINAFALPNGKVYVTRGLLALARDEAEVAAVLAHEIAHVTLDHARARAELAQKSALVTRVATDVLNDPAASRIARSEGRVTLARFSRDQELEADRIGVNVIARAGYDPFAAARFLMALDQQARLRSAGVAAGAEFLSTHPSTSERVSAAIAIARETGAREAVSGVDGAYAAALNGMLFGDAPSAGVVRGSTYASPRLGVAFDAPPQFTLEASADAVIGIARGGPGAFRFDHTPDAADVSLEEFLASGWVDGVSTFNMRALPDTPLPVIVAEGQGKELSYLLAAIRIDDRIFRLIYAMRQVDDSQRVQFEAMLRSIRKLSPEDARAVEPLRIRIVSAREGDTQESLAARMSGVDDPLARLRIMNGLGATEPVVLGRNYKIVE